MTRMRFHPQKHNSRSVFNRGMSEFFHVHHTQGQPVESGCIFGLILVIGLGILILVIALITI